MSRTIRTSAQGLYDAALACGTPEQIATLNEYLAFPIWSIFCIDRLRSGSVYFGLTAKINGGMSMIIYADGTFDSTEQGVTKIRLRNA